ncbi:MAG: F0F1 ATP synthase subunit B [Absicoccus porci]|uniref:ATP synthase subunit b n=1 Tax=Absicoccus porci TaxID=2486576 RepID=A0A3N0HZV1_9FIRM|nr:F0F1 ATP synthase subunit B [Absicoccus porci]MCI6087209.1 F0F1 ATP synthase subunit B [Absicoccus porci]MDD7329894.1 F0F1 ATP synthase subunit B [Absicoccus porci]MDY4737820.1 F0F1 ATP synthase subunit B [Absicoccus porci]RNM30177.1 ATP synthase F0 subunit B [Absicoccus porci]
MVDFNVANYLRINLQDMIMTLISTILIVLFAKHFFWDKILAFVKKRQDLIQDNIDSSENLKKAALAQKEKYDVQMQHAGQDAHVIIETARVNATQQKKEILDQANSEAARIKAKAQEDIDRDRLKAQDEMKEAISDVAIEAAKKLVDKEMDESTQRKFVDDFLAKAGDQQ